MKRHMTGQIEIALQNTRHKSDLGPHRKVARDGFEKMDLCSLDCHSKKQKSDMGRMHVGKKSHLGHLCLQGERRKYLG